MIEYLTLAFVLILSIIGHNSTVIYAAIIVLVLKIISQVSGQPFILEWMGSHGLNLGIIILTANCKNKLNTLKNVTLGAVGKV